MERTEQQSTTKTGVGSGWRDRLVLTRQEVADLLQVRPRQLDRLGVPCLDLGHKTKRYLQEDVQVWLDEQRQRSSRHRSAGGVDGKN